MAGGRGLVESLHHLVFLHELDELVVGLVQSPAEMPQNVLAVLGPGMTWKSSSLARHWSFFFPT